MVINDPRLHVYYAHLAFVRFDRSVCCESSMTIYIMFLAYLVEHSLVHWYQQRATIHHVPKCMSCHKVTVVITERAHCFPVHIYYAHLASVRFEHSSVCR